MKYCLALGAGLTTGLRFSAIFFWDLFRISLEWFGEYLLHFSNYISEEQPVVVNNGSITYYTWSTNLLKRVIGNMALARSFSRIVAGNNPREIFLIANFRYLICTSEDYPLHPNLQTLPLYDKS